MKTLKWTAALRRALLRASFVLGATGVSAGALAGQTATGVCLQSSDTECLLYELRVSITSDEDVGKTGAYGIGVWLANGGLAYWTAANGFSWYRGGLVQPVEGIQSSLPVGREYLIYSGPASGLCALSGGQAFDIYAGRGIIPNDKLAQLNWLLTQKIQLPVDHIRGAYIYQDVRNSPWKVSKVFSWSCNS